MFGGLAGLSRLGLLSCFGPAYLGSLLPNGARILPPDAWDGLRYFAAQREDYRTAAREASAAAEGFAEAHCEPGDLGALPLVVLTAEWWISGKPSMLKRTFYPLREEMPAYSTIGRHEIVAGTDHTNLPIIRPDAVARAVQSVLELSAKSAIVA